MSLKLDQLTLSRLPKSNEAGNILFFQIGKGRWSGRRNADWYVTISVDKSKNPIPDSLTV